MKPRKAFVGGMYQARFSQTVQLLTLAHHVDTVAKNRLRMLFGNDEAIRTLASRVSLGLAIHSASQNCANV